MGGGIEIRPAVGAARACHSRGAGFALPQILLRRLGKVGMVCEFQDALEISGRFAIKALLQEADAPVQIGLRVVWLASSATC